MATCPKGHESATLDYCDQCGRPMDPSTSAGAGGGSPSAAGSGSAGAAGGGSPGAAVPSAGASVNPPAAETRAACPLCQTPKTGRFCEVDGYDFLLAPPVDKAAPALSSPATDAAAADGAAAGPAAGAAAAGPDTAGAAAAGPDTAGAAAAGPAAAGPAAAGPAAAGPAAAGPAVAPAAAGPDTAGAAPRGWYVVVSADRAYFDAVVTMGGEDAGTLAFPRFVPDRRFPLRGGRMLIGRRSRSRGVEPDIDLVGPPEDPGVSHSHALLIEQPNGWAIVDLESANGTYVNDPSSAPIDHNEPVPLTDGDRVYVGAWTALTIHAA